MPLTEVSGGMRFSAIALLILALAGGRALAAQPGDDVVSNIARLPVESTALASVGYSRVQQILEIEFHSGAIYRYLDVPERVFRELLEAPSKAGYYNANIRGHYSSLHVVKPDP
jgi:KTSC domain